MVKTLTLSISEAQHADIVNYSNAQGITPEQATQDLIGNALRAGRLMRGVVSELTPEVQETLKQLNIAAIKEHQDQLAAAAPAPAEDQPATDENTLVFTAPAKVRELIEKINATRITKGLAPLQASLAEILLHYAEQLADNSVFNKVTGLEYRETKPMLTELALAEREANGAKSNIITASGMFSNYSIIDTPAAAQ